MKSRIIGIIIAVVIIPAAAFGYSNIQRIWGAPEKIDSIEQTLAEQGKVQKKLTHLVEKQDARLTLQEKVTEVQIESMKEMIQMMKAPG